MRKAYKIVAILYFIVGPAFVGASFRHVFMPYRLITGIVFILCGLACWGIMRQIEQQEGGR